MPHGTPLRSWLRRKPTPARIRLRLEDGEERYVDIPGSTRNRWQTVETACLMSGAEVVECLDAKGGILRAMPIEDTEEVKGDHERDRLASELERSEKGKANALATDRREQALMLDRYGARLNEAFEHGAAAANTGQENLVSLVETLTSHLSMAITNLHAVSVNFANSIQQQATGEEGGTDNTAMLAKVLGLAAMRAMGPGAATVPENGATKGAKK